MSDSNRVQLSYIKEVNYGITPGAAALQIVRFTQETLKQISTFVKSNEIRWDRQTPDHIRTSVRMEGDIGYELSGSAQDDFLQFALCSAGWSSPVTVDNAVATISAAAGDNSFNKAGGFTGTAVVNQWIKVSGFANAANNGYFKVTSVAGTKIIVTGGTLITEATGPAVTIIMGAQIVNGVTANSMSIEKKFTDLTNIFNKYVGAMIGGFNLAYGADSLLNGAFNLIGKSEASAVATIGTSYVQPPTKDILSGVDDLKKFLEGNSVLTICDFKLALQNNLRARLEAGNLGPTSIGQGNFDVSGSLQAYFATQALADKYRGEVASSLAMCFEDTGSPAAGYVFDLPSVKYTLGEDTTPGQSTDVIQNLNWAARMHPTELITMRIARW